MLKNKCYRLICLALATVGILTASPPALADFALRDWLYNKAISLPAGIAGEGLVEVIPDTEVFAGSLVGQADLRIISGIDTEVPYKLEISKSTREQTSFSVNILDKGYLPAQYTSFVADLGRSSILHNQVEFQTSSTNFRRTATVEASEDGNAWSRIAEQTVYDFTVEERSFQTRNTAIGYPESTARYLRVRVADGGEGQIQINGASIFYVKETQAREVQWPAKISGTSRDTEKKVTLVEIDLGFVNIPSYKLVLRVSDINFDRGVTIQASADREKWQTILSRTNIYVYDTPKFTGSSLTVSYPETPSRYLRLLIDDGDSPPLNVRGVDVWGLRRRLVFSVKPQTDYRLYYGNTEASRPAYDLEKVFPYLVTEQLPEARLGSQEKNRGFVEKKPPQPPLSERLPWLLPTVIGVAVFLVALLLVGIVRQARKVLPPPPQ